MRHIFATKAGEPKNKILAHLGRLVALILLAIVVGQFALLITPQKGVTNSMLIRTTVLIFFELQSIPFILGMRISPGLRVVSMGSGWLVAVSFLAIAIMTCASGAILPVKLLGMMEVHGGGLLVTSTLLFAVLIGLITRNRRPKADLDRKRVRKEQEKIFKETYGKK